VTLTAASPPEARAAKEAPEVTVEETVPLVPLPEKSSEQEEKEGIGFGEAVAQLPVEEGRGALEVPEKMGAEEYVALARGERKLPWKIFGFIGAGIVLAVLAFFVIKTLNRPKEKEKDSEGLYQEALRAQEVGDFERALSKFDQVARQYSQTPRARFALSSAADLEWRLGRQDKALEHYRMVVSGAADDSLGREGRFHRALILREQKKAPEALEALAGFVMDSTAGSRTLEAQMIAAELLHDQGLADSALAVYGKALSLDAGRVYAVQMHKERGLLFEEKGDWKAARAEYDAILAMTQTSDLSHVWAEQKASAMANKMMGKGR
jgi:tetratricopeptide (TPR) repeat protein